MIGLSECTVVKIFSKGAQALVATMIK